jgi:DNA mismatch endonuclease (patch repair protein)
MDRLTPERRSWLMSRIPGKHTLPEMTVRKALHARGLRYRLHPTDLPGKPDLVFRKRHIAIFVHGCFWHGHGCRAKPLRSKTNRAFWNKKIDGNRVRDRRAVRRLRTAGWTVFVLWECQIKKGNWFSKLEARLCNSSPSTRGRHGQRERT